jgi:pyruvate kinase
MRNTKIIATIGPATNTPDKIKNLIKAGLNFARMNFSHGEYAEHYKVYNTIRRISKELKMPVGILLDLQGPKIRVGRLNEGKAINLKRGMDFTITTRNIVGENDIVSTTYKDFAKDVKKGSRILIDDGLIVLKAISSGKTDVRFRVVIGGLLKENKGINLPGIKVSADSLTKKDKEDVLTGIKWGVDYFALSFVRSASDIDDIKTLIKKHGADIPVIAKIEKPEAMKEIVAITKKADGIMVARGDLAVETKPEKVPVYQKKLIQLARANDKVAIVATQMLESMITNAFPTRAEVSDVANAIYDGTDAVMLSGETAVGKYPIQAVKMMNRVAVWTEKNAYKSGYERRGLSLINQCISSAISNAACYTVNACGAIGIAAFTMSGSTARKISSHRPFTRIFGLTPDKNVFNRLNLLWGVTPVLTKKSSNIDSIVRYGEESLLKSKLVKSGDAVVVVGGAALKTGGADFIRVSVL